MRRLAFVVLLAAPLAAQDLFPRELQPVGVGTPGASALLDVTSDGLPDQIVFLFGGVLSGPSSPDSIAVLPGDGRGHFGTPLLTKVATVLPATTTVTPAVFTDLDGDGLVDAALVNRSFESSLLGLQILLGDGAAGWTASAALPLDMQAQDLEIADLDADGHADALVHSRYLLRFVPGDGSGGLLPGTVDTALDGGAVSSADDTDAAVGDIDGDGTLDVLLHEHDWLPEIEWRQGDGHGGFGPRQSIPIGVGQARRLALADFDVDGALDAAAQADFIVPSGLLAGETYPFLRVVKGDGHGGFGAALSFLMPPSISELHVADMNGDGRPDLVSAHSAAVVVTLDPLGPGTADSYGPPFGNPWSPGEGTLAIADIDSDGWLDAVTAGSDDAQAFSLRLFNDGTGLFESPPSYPAPAGAGLSLADVNADGRPDVLLWLQGGGNAWMAGDATGGFATAQPLPTSPAASSIAFADFTADGVPDIATANEATHDLSVLLADGRGGYADSEPGGWPWFAWNQFPGTVLAADLDGDGRPDILASRGSSPPLTLLRASGPGDFFPPVNFGSTNEPPGVLQLADMDDDGVLDLVTGRIWLNDGAAHFTPGTPINDEVDSLSVFGGVVPADFDADGHLDVAFGGHAYSQPSLDLEPLLDVRLGDGDGGLLPSAFWFVESNIFVHSAADLDGDGHADLVTPHTAAFGDGAGSFTGLRSWAADLIAVSDLDGDGRPDLLAFDTENAAVQTLLHLPTHFTWSNLGHGLAGAHGEPRLGGHGALSLGSTMEVHVDALPHDTLFTLILGAAQLGAPFKGGVLVPSPDRVIPGLPSGPDGFLSLPGTWPRGLPAEVELFLQAWVPDASAPQGWAASNALKLSPP